jgi:hypothetical protein
MILQHPSFPDITEDVPDDQAGDWLASGWIERPKIIDAPVQSDSTDTATISEGTVPGDDQGTPQ